jgi:hypothetical protein
VDFCALQFRTKFRIPLQGNVFDPVSLGAGQKAQRTITQIEQVGFPERSVIQFDHDQVFAD